MAINFFADDDESEEFDLRPPSPEIFQGPLPDYEILGLLGSGGMGKVYKARQPNLNRVVALKILSGSATDDDLFRFGERFQREATAMARLRHPNIISLYHFGKTDEGQLYFVMEYVEGAELSSYIRSGDAEPRHILYWAIQICSALQFAHESGIVHRDIKPSNLLIDERGDVKIADFGLAKFSRLEGNEPEAQLTRTDVVVGTPHFIAPELLEDPSAVTPACDLYSLGVTLYQALTGKLPWGVPAPPSQVVLGLDPRWDGILFRCLSGSPGKRFRSAAELQDCFEELLEGSDLIPVESLRNPILSRAAEVHSQKSNRSKLLLGGVTAACLAAVVAAFALWNHDRFEGDGASLPALAERDSLLPHPKSLQLTVPGRPKDGGKLAMLDFGDTADDSIHAEILEASNDLVRIWEQPGSLGVSGLRGDGTIWSNPEDSATDSRELMDLVWLAPSDLFTGALRADGRAFRWERGGNLSQVGDVESFVMIVPQAKGEAILLNRNGEVHRWSPGASTATEKVTFIPEECLAIGGRDDLFAAMSRSGLLRVWRMASDSQKTSDLLFERQMECEIEKSDANPSPYPDRWIPVVPWAVMGPQGEVFPLEKDAETAGLPSLEGIRPGSFWLGDSAEAGHAWRSGADWRFSGPWGRNGTAALEEFSAGAFQLVRTGPSAFALFPPTVDLAARMEPQEPMIAVSAESPPPPVTSPAERSWTGERVEIRIVGDAWPEATARSLLDSLDSHLDRIDPILVHWGATKSPQRLVIEEGKPDDSSNWETGWVHLAEGRLDALRKIVEKRELAPADFDFLPPAEAFRPIARKLAPPDSSVSHFGETESNLANFFRLFGEEISDGAAQGSNSEHSSAWEEGKTHLSSLILRADYQPGSAMSNPGTGQKFFSGLLAHLYDDCGGQPFLERLFNRELPALPDANSEIEGMDHLVVAASFAAGRSLLPFFQEELRWPVSPTAIDSVAQRFPDEGGEEGPSEFRAAPDELLSAWGKTYEDEILPLTVAHRTQLEELRKRYREALNRQIEQYEEAGRPAAATIFREERDRVSPGHVGPPSFHPVVYRNFDPAAQQAVRDLDSGLGRTYRERLRAIVAEASSASGGKVNRALDELYRLQLLFSLDGKDPSAQWAFDRREKEVKSNSLESVYSPRVPLEFTLRYEEMIRWAIEEGATVDLVQPITPTQVQRYTVRTMAEVQAGRFVWQRLKILGIRRGAETKPWSDIHLELVSRFEDLEVLECGCGALRASTLELISGLSNLSILSLRGAKIEATENAGLVAIGRMKLEKLSLAGAEFPREALSILGAGPISETLEELELANTDTADLLPLSGFRNLKRLDISGCAVPQQNIDEFNRANRNCLVVR